MGRIRFVMPSVNDSVSLARIKYNNARGALHNICIDLAQARRWSSATGTRWRVGGRGSTERHLCGRI